MSKATRALPRRQLVRLYELLTEEGYRVIGPTIRDGAIVYDELAGTDELPVGWTDEQAPGRYRLKNREDDRAFGYVVGPHSWKCYLFPSRERIVSVESTDGGLAWSRPPEEAERLAFLGVRACEIAAIEIQDKVFLGGPFTEAAYSERREKHLVIAVNCLEAGDLCFCASMDTGPRVESGYDLCLTELDAAYLVDAGSERGAELLERLPTRAVEPEETRAADRGIEECRERMGRSLDTRGLPELLMGNLDHPRWDDVAARCLACANCTLVCPTCFCFSVDDVSGLDPTSGARERSWDSCFTSDHSRIPGAEFRPTTRDRYRQWLTHKLGTWHAQFGTSGCVGCGRCIAWCPPGIDLTEEAAALRVDAAPPIALEPHRAPAVQAVDEPLVPRGVRVLDVHRETHDTVTLTLEAPPGYSDASGQFNMLSLPGVGEVPISVSGRDEGRIEHTIRAVGAVTDALCRSGPGTTVGLRGPFGHGWPLELAGGREVVVLAGGIGIAPLRGVLLHMAAHPDDYPVARLIYGARSPRDLIFDETMLEWQRTRTLRAAVTVDHSEEGWKGNVGTVLAILGRKEIPVDAMYWMCGPEVMMRLTVNALEAAGVPHENIYVSLERNMKCAAGFCGRCQYGPHFICKDGPVFRYDRVAYLFGREGF